MSSDRLPGVTDALQIAAQHVRTSQILRLPVPPDREAAVKARLRALDAAKLSEQYADFIERWTHHLIHIERRGERLTLSLTPHGPPLLRLRLQDRAPGNPALVVARLTIMGGIAAVPSIHEGSLVLRLGVRNDERVSAHGESSGAVLEAEVLVEDYAPLLLALPLPGTLRAGVYRASQARIHRAVTTAFLRAIAQQTMG